MKSHAVFASAGAILLALATPASAESLTIDEIVQLTEIGLGDEAIIAKIKAEESSFDLSTDQMIDLKKKGVSSAVIAAMLDGKANKKIEFSMDSPDPMVPHPAGLYLLRGTGENAKMQRINATVSTQAKTGGIFGFALTGGIASASVKVAIQNETAITTATNKPRFFFFFDEANDAAAFNAFASGLNTAVNSPAEFTLIELKQKDGRREARVGSRNIAGTKTGVMDEDRLAFHYNMIRPGVFEVKANEIMKPGEYGFIFPLTGEGTNGALTARIFDFSVR